MKRMRPFALGLVLSWLPASAFALGFGSSEKADGGQPGAFLSASASARPLAMGGAHVAIADDATAPFWNASGLAQIQRFDLVTNYNRLGADASIGSGAFAIPTRGFGTFGLNVVSLRSGSYKRRDAQNTDLGDFENNAAAYLLSQGLNLGTRWSAGYTVKMIQQKIDTRSDTGYGADLGLMFRPHALWQLGLAVQNVLSPQLKLKSETEKYPRDVRVGGRYSPISRLSLAADVSFVEKSDPEVSLGTEWRVAAPLALRAGVNDREFSAGIGVSAGDLGVDYAFGLPHASVVRDELGSGHRISFHLAFGANVMQGSYRDLVRRRDEQRIEVVREKKGVDHLETLRRRMAGWDGKMDVSTFESIQQVRQSLRQMAFTSQDQADEAQAYVLHFQGRFSESALIFDRLTKEHPRNRRLRDHAAIADRRARTHPAPVDLASAYKDLDDQDRRRREAHAAEIVRATQVSADAGGAGSSAASAVQAGGETQPTVPAVMALPPLLPPVDEAPAPEPVAAAAQPVAAAEETPAIVPAPVVASLPVEPEEAVPAVAAPVAVEETVAPPLASAEPEAPPVSPQLASAKTEEARAYFQEGDYVSSHLAAQKAIEADPSNRAAARQAMLTNSAAAEQASLSDPTASVNMTAIEARVEKSLKLFDDGMNFYNAGKKEDAMAYWEEAVRACPANFLARKMMDRVAEERLDEQYAPLLTGSRKG